MLDKNGNFVKDRKMTAWIIRVDDPGLTKKVYEAIRMGNGKK